MSDIPFPFPFPSLFVCPSSISVFLPQNIRPSVAFPVSTSSRSSLHFSFLSLCNSLNLRFFIEFFWVTSSCANSAVPCQDSHLCLSVSFLLFFLILFDLSLSLPSAWMFCCKPPLFCWKNAFLPSCPLFIPHNSSKLHKSYCINILSLQFQCTNAIVVAFLLSI